MNIKKHLLLCATPTKQKCFKGNEGLKTWECLKKPLKKFENDPLTKKFHAVGTILSGHICLIIWELTVFIMHILNLKMKKV